MTMFVLSGKDLHEYRKRVPQCPACGTDTLWDEGQAIFCPDPDCEVCLVAVANERVGMMKEYLVECVRKIERTIEINTELPTNLHNRRYQKMITILDKLMYLETIL